jgi:hypothetical protein
VTTFELLEVARERNIEFEVRGDRLFQRGPAGAMTEELRVEIRQQKTTLVALLDPAGRFVALKGGLVVPAAALILASIWKRETFHSPTTRMESSSCRPR